MFNLIRCAEDFRGPEEPPMQIGSVVRLNSGGPMMVVVDIIVPGERLLTAWYYDGEYYEDEFHDATVHRILLGSNTTK
jgi:uncharacterized protein YodC (DUF2158 family)